MPEARGVARPYTPTALPSVAARALAFVAIVIGGICGGLIAYSVTDLQCGSDDGRTAVVLPAPPAGRPAPDPAPVADDEGCTTIAGLAGLAGATASAGAVSIIVVLVLRAMAEWRRDLAPGA
ncbi:MAG: hypothetical protein M3N37_02825 [Actinomycetota bacterium]|nr:hypothetical protein [Actinomycetota bacterium]